MSDGDAVETAARADYETWFAPVRIPWEQQAEEMRDKHRASARAVIQALVDGGHYVPASAKPLTIGVAEGWALRAERERDAAITRAETLAGTITYLKTQTEQVQLALAEAVELLCRWRDPRRVGPLGADIDAFLARQAVTEKPE